MVAVAQAQEPPQGPAHITGQCLTYQQEVRGLQDELEEAVRLPTERLSAVNAALQVVGLAQRDNAGQAQAMRARAQEIQAQIRYHQDLLRGEARPEDEALPREQVEAELQALHRELDRVELLAQVYAADDPWERQRLQGTLALEKLELEQLVEVRRQPYRDQIDRLREQARGLSELLDQAMKPFGRPASVGELQTEAVRVNSRFEHGLIQFRWLDRRGQMVASAQVNLRAQPETDRVPPLLLDRYPILQQSQQEVIVGVGYFQVQFRSDSQDLIGEGRVLEAVQRLLDLEALSQLVPQVGQDTTN